MQKSFSRQVEPGPQDRQVGAQGPEDEAEADDRQAGGPGAPGHLGVHLGPHQHEEQEFGNDPEALEFLGNDMRPGYRPSPG